MIENMKVRRFKEEDAQEVRNLIVRNFLEVNSKDYGISAMEKLAKAYFQFVKIWRRSRSRGYDNYYQR